MKIQRFGRLLDAGILVLVIAAARLTIAQEPRGTEPPRPVAPPRVGPPVAPRAAPALAPTAPTRPATADDAPPGSGYRPASTHPMAPPTLPTDGRIALQLKDGSRLVGKLVGMDKLKLKTSFGEIDVPVEAILGLKFHESSRPTETAALTATILFKNGDVLTAEPIIANLKLEASWGDTTVAGKHVESLVTTSEKVAWAFDGSKWRIMPEGARSGYGPPSAGSPYSPYAPAAFVPVGPGGSGSYTPVPVFSVPDRPTEFTVPMTLPAPMSPPSPAPGPG